MAPPFPTEGGGSDPWGDRQRVGNFTATVHPALGEGRRARARRGASARGHALENAVVVTAALVAVILVVILWRQVLREPEVVATSGAASPALQPSQGSEAPAVLALVPDAGTEAAAPGPEGASVLPEVPPAAVALAADAGLASSPPGGEVAPEGAPSLEQAKDPTPKTAPARAAASKRRGKLTLKTTPRVTVYLDDKRLGSTPIVKMSLPAGRHTLRLVNGRTQAEQLVEVQIRANRTTVKRLKL